MGLWYPLGPWYPLPLYFQLHQYSSPLQVGPWVRSLLLAPLPQCDPLGQLDLDHPVHQRLLALLGGLLALLLLSNPLALLHLDTLLLL